MNHRFGNTALAASLVAAFFLALHMPGAVSQTMPTSLPTSGELDMVSSMLPTGVQQLVVLDHAAKVMAVYHVEPQGKIQLKSVRNLVWDLRMEQFNANAPLPSELRQVQP